VGPLDVSARTGLHPKVIFPPTAAVPNRAPPPVILAVYSLHGLFCDCHHLKEGV